ncbi:MAG TPA: Na+/H+ antiporter [Bryobacteraceae bacterium]|jgi:CPA1 family monovalent cation:H+ antiporter
MLWFFVFSLVVIGGAIGRRWPIPEAVVWCALGFIFGFAPGAAGLTLSSKAALLLLLPPLVYAAAVRLPWPEFRDNAGPIVLLAFGLVVLNALAATYVSHRLIGLPWALAFALGAVLSPTDPAAAVAVAARAGIPGRLAAILEGEGLVDDAVALTLVHLAVEAAVTRHFSLESEGLQTLAIVVGEPLYGWLVGRAVMFLRRHILDPRLEIAVTLLTPFAAYLPCQYLGGSGVLATVTAGMYIGERRADVAPAGNRLHAASVWEIVVFLLYGALFVMAGIELCQVVQGTPATRELLVWGLGIAGMLIALRGAWCGLMWGFFHKRTALREEGNRHMPGRHMTVIAGAGMRGPISLAAALSIPLSAEISGAEFQTVLFITAVVIAVTLVAQGIALPHLVRVLHVARDAASEHRDDEQQIAFAEGEAARAAMEHLALLETRGQVTCEAAAKLRAYYKDRLSEIESGADRQPVLLSLIEAERARVERLRAEELINDRVAAELERMLDLRESGLRGSQIAA